MNIERSNPVCAARDASSRLLSPSFLEITDPVPTAKPIANAVTRSCIGRAYERAKTPLVASKAPMKILSTILYIACTNIEKIAGPLIFKISLPTGTVPNLSEYSEFVFFIACSPYY